MNPRKQADLPDLSGKLYYTISEVSELCGVKPHVLRYWESEFPSLRPRKGRGGSRRYRVRDIEEILTIKSLLHDQGYRIDGARRFLGRRQKPGEALLDAADSTAFQLSIPFSQLDHTEQLDQVRRELRDVLALVRSVKSRRARSARG
jgi:DNA-binding transcriptional MerR regulator